MAILRKQHNRTFKLRIRNSVSRLSINSKDDNYFVRAIFSLVDRYIPKLVWRNLLIRECPLDILTST